MLSGLQVHRDQLGLKVQPAHKDQQARRVLKVLLVQRVPKDPKDLSGLQAPPDRRVQLDHLGQQGQRARKVQWAPI